MSIYISLILIVVVTIPLFIYNKYFYLGLNTACIFCVMAFRGSSVGADTISYRDLFMQSTIQALPNNFINWLFPLQNQRFETGFVIYNKFINSFTHNFQVMLIVNSLIIIGCLIFFIVKLKVNYPLALLVFLCLGNFANTMNLMRQGLAWAFTLVAFVFCVERKPVKYLVFVILASGMHATAWLFLIVYPLTKLRLTPKKVILSFLLGALILEAFESFFNIFSNYSVEVSTFSNQVGINNTNGASNLILNIFIMGVIFVLSYRQFSLSNNSMTEVSNLVLKSAIIMNLLGIIVTIVAFKFSQLFRIQMYFSSSEIILIPYLLNRIKNSYLRALINVGVILLLITYFVAVQILRPDWSGIIPFQWGV